MTDATKPVAWTSAAQFERMKDKPGHNHAMWGEPLPYHEDIPLYGPALLEAYEAMKTRAELLEFEAERSEAGKRDLAELLGCADELRWKWMRLAVTKLIKSAEAAEAKCKRLREALEEIRDQDANHAVDVRCKCTDADKLAEVRTITRAVLGASK